MTLYLGPISIFLGAKRALFTKVNGESEKGKCLLGCLGSLGYLSLLGSLGLLDYLRKEPRENSILWLK